MFHVNRLGAQVHRKLLKGVFARSCVLHARCVVLCLVMFSARVKGRGTLQEIDVRSKMSVVL